MRDSPLDLAALRAASSTARERLAQLPAWERDAIRVVSSAASSPEARQALAPLTDLEGRGSTSAMTSAELRTSRESLGLSVDWLAKQAGVAARTIRHWESRPEEPPEDVAALIEGVEAQSVGMVVRAIATYNELAEGFEGVDLRRFRTDQDLWARHPETSGLPASWHASVLARIRRELIARGIECRIIFHDE